MGLVIIILTMLRVGELEMDLRRKDFCLGKHFKHFSLCVQIPILWSVYDWYLHVKDSPISDTLIQPSVSMGILTNAVLSTTPSLLHHWCPFHLSYHQCRVISNPFYLNFFLVQELPIHSLLYSCMESQSCLSTGRGISAKVLWVGAGVERVY